MYRPVHVFGSSLLLLALGFPSPTSSPPLWPILPVAVPCCPQYEPGTLAGQPREGDGGDANALLAQHLCSSGSSVLLALHTECTQLETTGGEQTCLAVLFVVLEANGGLRPGNESRSVANAAQVEGREKAQQIRGCRQRRTWIV